MQFNFKKQSKNPITLSTRIDRASAPTIYHEGIYTSLADAKHIQSEVYGITLIKTVLCIAMHRTVFINVIPHGDCHIETCTTSPS